MLKVNDLACFRQSRCLFAGLQFQLDAGHICQVEGPNGAGKSTLLRTIMGLFRADEGEIYWHNEIVDKQWDSFYFDALYLGHKFAINPDLTAKQNINHWRTLHPCNELSAEQVLEIVGLLGMEDIPCQMLSAGQHRKVALTRLWLSTAKLWVLDEPFTAIDKQGVQLLQHKFAQHLEQGGAILMTSHQDMSHQFERLQTLSLLDYMGEE